MLFTWLARPLKRQPSEYNQMVDVFAIAQSLSAKRRFVGLGFAKQLIAFRHRSKGLKNLDDT